MSPPVLWHLKVSNFNEKARWALDYKRVEHKRRAVLAGTHPRVAKKLSGGSTLPILVIDGQAIGDTTEIVAELERRSPDPPLYPADAAQREEALALEDFFDEELGPYIRRLVISYMLEDRDVFIGAFFPDARGAQRLAIRAAFPLLRRRIEAAMGIDERGCDEAREKIVAAGERVRGAAEYLVGDTFTVADLTFGALVAPAVAPEQFPYPQPHRGHPVIAPMSELLVETGIDERCRRLYARHRGVSVEVPS